MFIDTHAHLGVPQFASDLPAVLERAQQNKVSRIINVACDAASFELNPVLQANPAIYCSFGIDPGSLQDWNAKMPQQIRKLIKTMPRVVAVGETGLDFHWKPYDEPKQRAVFQAHLELAQEFDLPVIVHSRAAEKEVLQMLQTGNIKKAVLHCYAGNLETAKQALELGYYLSFTGIITYPKNDALRQVVSALPLDKILLESDCPYLPPQSQRGLRNEPAFLVETAKCLAELKKVSLEEIAQQTSENAVRLFKF